MLLRSATLLMQTIYIDLLQFVNSSGVTGTKSQSTATSLNNCTGHQNHFGILTFWDSASVSSKKEPPNFTSNYFDGSSMKELAFSYCISLWNIFLKKLNLMHVYYAHMLIFYPLLLQRPFPFFQTLMPYALPTVLSFQLILHAEQFLPFSFWLSIENQIFPVVNPPPTLGRVDIFCKEPLAYARNYLSNQKWQRSNMEQNSELLPECALPICRAK